jgi:hypothetical protein
MIALQFKKDVIATALVRRVVPALAASVDAAAQEIAREEYGDEANVFDLDSAGQQLISLLAQYLLITGDIETENGLYPLLSRHQLADLRYAYAFFDMAGMPLTPPPANEPPAGAESAEV